MAIDMVDITEALTTQEYSENLKEELCLSKERKGMQYWWETVATVLPVIS